MAERKSFRSSTKHPLGPGAAGGKQGRHGTTPKAKPKPKNKSVLPGNRLSVSKGTPSNLAKPSRYVVKRGDNLSTIAKKQGTTLAKILELNPKLRKNPDLIFSGTKVRLK